MNSEQLFRIRNLSDNKEYLNGLFCYKRERIYKINIRYGWLKDLYDK